MGPVAHSSFGYLGWKLSDRRDRRGYGFLFLFIALLPDIDFLLAFIFPGAGIVHQVFTHNIFFAGLTAGIVLLLFKPLRRRWWLVAMVVVSHLLLDLLVRDPVPPLGIMLFYPLWKEPLNLGIFPNLWRDGLEEIFSLHNLLVVILEFVILILPVWVFIRFRDRRGKRG